jgi:hypothetical protein
MLFKYPCLIFVKALLLLNCGYAYCVGPVAAGGLANRRSWSRRYLVIHKRQVSWILTLFLSKASPGASPPIIIILFF